MLLEEEAGRFTALLAEVEPPAGAADALREAARSVRTHRAELPSGPAPIDVGEGVGEGAGEGVGDGAIEGIAEGRGS